jgi:hypothetical protein
MPAYGEHHPIALRKRAMLLPAHSDQSTEKTVLSRCENGDPVNLSSDRIEMRFFSVMSTPFAGHIAIDACFHDVGQDMVCDFAIL